MRRLRYEIAEITPQMARDLLASNTRNRKLLRPYVRRLAGAMLRGEWTTNGEPIHVADDGTLLNGQHRLEAIIEADLSVSLLVVTGLPSHAQWTIDTGARRKLSDVLTLKGETETTNLAAMLGLLHRYRTGSRLDNSGRTAPTTREALDLLTREPGIRDHLRLARRVHRHTKMRVSVVALFAYLFEEVDEGGGVAFFEALCEARDAPVGDPTRALQAILKRNSEEQSYRLTTYSLCAMTIKSFNAWRDGTSIVALSFRPGGEAPEAFPVIRAPIG